MRVCPRRSVAWQRYRRPQFIVVGVRLNAPTIACYRIFADVSFADYGLSTTATWPIGDSAAVAISMGKRSHNPCVWVIRSYAIGPPNWFPQRPSTGACSRDRRGCEAVFLPTLPERTARVARSGFRGPRVARLITRPNWQTTKQRYVGNGGVSKERHEFEEATKRARRSRATETIAISARYDLGSDRVIG
jgi:hypothetical protein